MTGGEEKSRGVVWRRRVSVILVVWLFGVAGSAVATVKRARNADRRKGRGCILVWLCLRLKSVKCGDFGFKERRMVEARIVHEECGCKFYVRLCRF